MATGIGTDTVTWTTYGGTSGTHTTIDGTAYLDTDYNAGNSFVPEELADEGFEPIQGNPKGAKYLVSYMFREPIDPVVFLKNEKEMKLLIKELMENDKVDQKTILVSRISSQFKPKKITVKKVVKEVDYKLEKLGKKA